MYHWVPSIVALLTRVFIQSELTGTDNQIRSLRDGENLHFEANGFNSLGAYDAVAERVRAELDWRPFSSHIQDVHPRANLS